MKVFFTGDEHGDCACDGFTVLSGAIIDPYPTILGNAISQQCSFPIRFTFTGVISGYRDRAHGQCGGDGDYERHRAGNLVPGETLTGPVFAGLRGRPSHSRQKLGPVRISPGTMVPRPVPLVIPVTATLAVCAVPYNR